jgi:retinol dehydrogenase 12
MPDLHGKVYLITGASSGIGRVTALRLAEQGAKVWLACRNLRKTEPLVSEIASTGGKAELVELDLSDLESVRTCAARVLAAGEPLHCLINNAGLAGKRGLSRQGFELTFAVNHLGHFLLTELLLSRLLAQPGASVVNVSSKAHYGARGIDFAALRRPGKGIGAFGSYQVSKLCNVLHAKELARRYGPRGLRAYSLHPGVIKSDVWREIPQPFRYLLTRRMLSNEEGAKTTLYCATSAGLADKNGGYFDDCREKAPSELAERIDLAAELWDRSAAFVATAVQ